MYSKEELKNLKKEFWEGFDIFCSNMPELSYRKKKWMLYDTKIKSIDLKFDTNRDAAFVILEINHRDRDSRLNIYNKIEPYKNIVNSFFEEPLIWDDAFICQEGKEVCHIYIKKANLDIHRRIQWMEFYTFMANNMLRMEDAFQEIRDFIE
jgi:hypothetical protein